MSLRACAHEKEVKELLRGGQWPQGCGADLRKQAAGCRRCSELVLLRGAMQGIRAGEMAAARLEAPGVIWWRAQLQRRNAALEQVAKPLRAAQMFALVVVVSFAAGFAVSEMRHSSEWMARISEFENSISVASLLSGWGLLIVVSSVVCVGLLGAVAFFVASERG